MFRIFSISGHNTVRIQLLSCKCTFGCPRQLRGAGQHGAGHQPVGPGRGGQPGARRRAARPAATKAQQEETQKGSISVSSYYYIHIKDFFLLHIMVATFND